MSGVVDLLQAIVRIPSVSGDEAACRDYLVDWLAKHGVQARASGRNVVAVVEGELPAPPERGLLLLTHIDVVPVGAGWTRDPWDGAIEDGRLHGRGANDAKASAAAMAWVARRVDPARLAGRLVVVLACDEETGGEGIEACRDELPDYTASVVGEPTELEVCPGQRGLYRAQLTVRGRSCHASRPWEGENAIVKAAAQIRTLDGLDLGAEDPALGPATLQATVIAGGTRPNVLPGEVTLQLDGRPTPSFTAADMTLALRSSLDAELEVLSERFEPVRTPVDAEIVRLARAASPTGQLRRFGGVSDLFHVRHVPGVVMGPGTSEQSHSADESVALDQVQAAATSYAQIVEAYLAPAEGVQP